MDVLLLGMFGLDDHDGEGCAFELLLGQEEVAVDGLEIGLFEIGFPVGIADVEVEFVKGGYQIEGHVVFFCDFEFEDHFGFLLVHLVGERGAVHQVDVVVFVVHDGHRVLAGVQALDREHYCRLLCCFVDEGVLVVPGLLVARL